MRVHQIQKCELSRHDFDGFRLFADCRGPAHHLL